MKAAVEGLKAVEAVVSELSRAGRPPTEGDQPSPRQRIEVE